MAKSKPRKTKHNIIRQRRAKETTYYDRPKYYGDRLRDGFDSVNPDMW